jgi:glucosyl-dolichyl phosphate glucuronosyltransferase
VESFSRRCDRVSYLFEGTQGKSHALNSAIQRSSADLIGMVDDDEQVDANWLRVVEEWFSRDDVDFIGGPYLGLWRTTKPPWLPPRGCEGVFSASDPESIPKSPQRFCDNDMFFMQGGNAVVRRSLLQRVGPYSTTLLRFGANSSEDFDMFARITAVSKNGYYVPSLSIYHVVPPERMTKKYIRRWVWGNQKSYAIMADSTCRQNVAKVGLIPRYMIGNAVRGLGDIASLDPAIRFAGELELWRLAGFVSGAYL